MGQCVRPLLNDGTFPRTCPPENPLPKSLYTGTVSFSGPPTSLRVSEVLFCSGEEGRPARHRVEPTQVPCTVRPGGVGTGRSNLRDERTPSLNGRVCRCSVSPVTPVLPSVSVPRSSLNRGHHRIDSVKGRDSEPKRSRCTRATRVRERREGRTCYPSPGRITLRLPDVPGGVLGSQTPNTHTLPQRGRRHGTRPLVYRSDVPGFSLPKGHWSRRGHDPHRYVRGSREPQ